MAACHVAELPSYLVIAVFAKVTRSHRQPCSQSPFAPNRSYCPCTQRISGGWVTQDGTTRWGSWATPVPRLHLSGLFEVIDVSHFKQKNRWKDKKSKMTEGSFCICFQYVLSDARSEQTPVILLYYTWLIWIRCVCTQVCLFYTLYISSFQIYAFLLFTHKLFLCVYLAFPLSSFLTHTRTPLTQIWPAAPLSVSLLMSALLLS